MLAARLDLALTGPGLAVHVHGESPTFVADIHIRRSVLVRLPDVLRTLGRVRRLSKALRAHHLRVNVRIGGREVGRLGS